MEIHSLSCFKINYSSGILVALSVKCLTLDSYSGHDFRVLILGLVLGFMMAMEPDQDVLFWAAQVAQQFSTTLGPGYEPGGPGLSNTLGSLRGACFSLCLCLCLSLSLCVSLMNK